MAVISVDKTIKPGDIVTLVGGGPPMTVNEVYSGSIECIWFDKSIYNEDSWSGPHRDIFHLEAVKKVK